MPELSLPAAVRLVELGLAWAVMQRGLEHLGRPEQWLFAVQMGLAVLLMGGWAREFSIWGLWGCLVWQLHVFRGPYNGGADKLALLMVTCLSFAHLAGLDNPWAEMAMAYLAVQVVLSYFVSGWVKLCRAEWRRGAALGDVFAVSIYPVSDRVRQLTQHERLLLLGTWAVILFEVLFPLALLDHALLLGAMGIGAAFHLANAMLLGLNRFFWIWISAYPALFWFQGRVF